MATLGKTDILHHLKQQFSRNELDDRHKQLTDFFPAIIYVLDADQKKIKYVNENRITESLGYSLDDIKSWNDDVLSLVFKDDLELVRQELDNYHSLKDDDDYCYNCRLNHKKGDWRYYRTRGTVLRRNAEGKGVSFLFIAEDVNDRTKSEEEATALKKLVDDTEDLLHFGSWSWDIKVDKVYWTDGMFTLLGYKKEDIQSRISHKFYKKHLSPQDAKAFQKIINSAIKNKRDFEYTYALTTGKGAKKTVSTKGKIVLSPSGEVAKLLGITRDITEQIKINSDLIHYKEMILEKEEFLNQGSWETSIQDGTTTWSKGMYRLFGYDPEKDRNKLAVTNELHFSHMSEEEVRRSKADWNIILKERDNYTREATITTEDGNKKQLETYGKIIRDKNGNAIKVIGTTRDVTRLREYEKGLEEKIKELNRSNTELEDFAYVASHDLQEPLRKLTAFSERLQSKFTAVLGKEGMMYLERIVAATENMRILIDNLLEFSRTARSAKHFSQVNLGKILEDVKNDLELKIEESGTLLTYDSLPTLELIHSQIKQLFDNLVSNSIKFKQPDRPSVIAVSCEKLTDDEKTLHNLRSEKNYFKLMIEDNGIGFEKEYEERIFQMFQRLHGKAEYPGSGIGLAICKKIVENHNGIISANGRPGKGAVFTVILPENQ